MARMTDIAREAEEAVFGRREREASELAAIASDLGRMTAVIASMDENALLRRLHERHLGCRLNPAEVDTVIAFVAGLEYPRTPAITGGDGPAQPLT